jgi:uncharacterized protein (TIGR00369 family)
MNHSEFEAFYRNTCNFDRHMNMRLKVHEFGKITYCLRIDECHLSFPTACHGGVIAGIMDATLGVTALSWAIPRGKLCATVEFKTHFFEPVKPGDELEGSGEIDFTGSRLVVTTARIVDTTTECLVAKGMGTFTLYPISKKGNLLANLWPDHNSAIEPH